MNLQNGFRITAQGRTLTVSAGMISQCDGGVRLKLIGGVELFTNLDELPGVAEAYGWKLEPLALD